MTPRTHKTKVFLAATALLLAGGLAVRAQDDTETRAKVNAIFRSIESGRLEQIWAAVAKLEDMGLAATDAVSEGLKEGPKVRLGTAKALLSVEGTEAFRPQALRALKDLVFSKEERALRIMSAELLIQHGGKSDMRSLRKKSQDIADPYVKIAVLKGLRSFGRRELKKFLESDDPALRADAALALAETGNVEAAKRVLDKLKLEPTDRGQRARMYLLQDRLLERVDKYKAAEDSNEIIQSQNDKIRYLEKQLAEARVKARRGPVEGEDKKAFSSKFLGSLNLLDEIMHKVQLYYVDDKKTKAKDLVQSALNGMIEDLDPFSSYMPEAEAKAFDESLQQEYGGIGAILNADPESGHLVTVQPIYNGPAYQAGLRTLDRIVEIEGEATKGRDFQDLVKVLKGKEDTAVTIKVKRFLGDSEELVPIAITRRRVKLPSVRYDLLPGGIGYITLAHFGFDTVRELLNAIQELDRRGMNGLVLDLRGNPGGLLDAAVAVCDMFLPAGKIVVYQQGRKESPEGKRKEHRTKHPQLLGNFPLTILINEESASASEIVSGALKVHKRATIVGQRSFGKGSVQKLFDVDSTGKKSRLRLTIAYYYLPDGTLIHRERSTRDMRIRSVLDNLITGWEQSGIISPHQSEVLHDMYKPSPGGVAPDVTIAANERTLAERLKLAEVERSQLIVKYIKNNYVQHRKLFHKLAIYDGEDEKAYPGFEDQIMAKITNGLDVVTVRNYLRTNLRRFVQDDLGRELPQDFQGDNQLERGISEVVKGCGLTAEEIPEYKGLAKRVRDQIARIAKEEAAKKEAEEKAKKAAEAEKDKDNKNDDKNDDKDDGKKDEDGR